MAAEPLLARAEELLAGNTRHAFRHGHSYRFTIPSEDRYRFQWFWDSCFHAIVWARLDVERAGDELRGLLALQAPNGRIPHVVFWDDALVSRVGWHYLESPGLVSWFLPGDRPRATAMIQPPVIAQAVEAIVEAGGEAFLDEALPALERYYRYLDRERDPDGDGLISIITQFESGLDFSPAYDPAHGAGTPLILGLAARLPQVANKLVDWKPGLAFRLNPRHVEDVLVNSVYADALQALARLAARRGAAELEHWARATAVRVLGDAARALLRRPPRPLLQPERPERTPGRSRQDDPLPAASPPRRPAPRDRNGPDRAPHRRGRSSGPRSRSPRSLSTSRPFGTTRASTAADGSGAAPAHSTPTGCSRSACDATAEDALADELAARSRELVELGGFNEFYDPLSGTPVGAHRFGWATLAALM